MIDGMLRTISCSSGAKGDLLHRLSGVFFLLISSFSLSIFSPDTHANESMNGKWVFSIDNDVLSSSDDHYTNGVQVSWVSAPLEKYSDGPVPDRVSGWLSGLPVVNRSGRQRFISYSISHRIFTPTDIDTKEPIKGDIPYSAMLFGTLTAGAQDEDSMDAFGIHAGIAGPSALGEEIQNEFHRWIGASHVNGWRNQINDEPIIDITYEHRRRIYDFGGDSGLRGDVITQAGGAAGNIISMLTLGLGFRYGINLGDDFLLPPQFFGEETIGSQPFTHKKNNDSMWVFLLINGSYIGNAIFWDGNTFKDSHSVSYNHEIARLYAGIMGKKGAWSGGFSLVRTTVPWENLEDRSNQTYGRLSLSYSY